MKGNPRYQFQLTRVLVVLWCFGWIIYTAITDHQPPNITVMLTIIIAIMAYREPPE